MCWRCATCSASRRCTPSAGPRRSPCSRTGCLSSARRWIWSAGPATSMWSPPSDCSAAGSTSTPRPGRPRSRCWPTGPPIPVHVAADLISQAEHDPQAAAVLVTDSTEAGRVGPGRAGRPGARGQARRTDQEGPAPASSPRWCWWTTWPRGSTWSTRTRPSTWRSRPPTPHGLPAGSATPARSSSVPGHRCRWATTAPAAPTCCPPADAPATPRGSPSGASSRRCT